MKAAAVAALLLLTVGGCDPPKNAYSWRMRGPDGHMWWAVSCEHEQSNCWREAAARCPNGYEVADSESHASGGVAYRVGGVTALAATRQGEMLVKCKAPPVAAKAASTPGPENGWEPEDGDEATDGGP